ncbi:MAG: hypothetical protein K2X93_07885 [Candidatus Obscuribacterales bacterium]|nr:hypothetical protein [Candidatus Obscuribacterales bacterium]
MVEKKTICGDPTCATDHGVTTVTVANVAKVPAKVKFVYKLINFSLAVIALSWFFEGWRKINECPSFAHFGILLAGTIFTLVFLGVHGYWVYVEEKLKGTLKKRVELFERIYVSQCNRVGVTKKGDN